MTIGGDPDVEVGEVVGTCEWCGGVVATDQNRLNHGHMWWHRGCADRIQNILGFEATEYDADFDGMERAGG